MKDQKLSTQPRNTDMHMDSPLHESDDASTAVSISEPEKSSSEKSSSENSEKRVAWIAQQLEQFHQAYGNPTIRAHIVVLDKDGFLNVDATNELAPLIGSLILMAQGIEPTAETSDTH